MRLPLVLMLLVPLASACAGPTHDVLVSLPEAPDAGLDAALDGDAGLPDGGTSTSRAVER